MDIDFKNKTVKITGGSLDLVTNFASPREISRDYFDYYLKSPPFQTAGYFFTANRIDSAPDYNTNLTIRDYPVWKSGKKMHFGISPIFSNTFRYPGRKIFFNERVALPFYFEYIGDI